MEEKKTEKTVYDVNSHAFVNALAEELKKIPFFEMPEWAKFVKTGTAKERPPFEVDWWYKRAASILRQLYTKKVVGVSRLRTRYGSKKDRGVKPKRFRKASGKIIRLILQQAEKALLVEKSKGKKAGRVLSEKGKAFLNEIASNLK